MERHIEPLGGKSCLKLHRHANPDLAVFVDFSSIARRSRERKSLFRKSALIRERSHLLGSQLQFC